MAEVANSGRVARVEFALQPAIGVLTSPRLIQNHDGNWQLRSDGRHQLVAESGLSPTGWQWTYLRFWGFSSLGL